MKQLLIIGAFVLASCGESKRLVAETARPAGMATMGRTVRNADGSVTLGASAASCYFSFEGDSCAVYLKNVAPYEGDYNYINIELDGKYQGRKRIDGKEEVRVSVRVKEKIKTHQLVISKATEASNGQVIITSISASNIKKTSSHFTAKIEFIGNSITCGFGNDMEIPCGNGSKWYDQHNAYWSYAPQTARAVNAEFMITAISGAGIYRNWNSDGPTVPQQYENTFLNTDSSNRWNFSAFTPDIVTVALGTNDLSNGDGKTPRLPFNKNTFINTYKKFIRVILSHYPNAQLVLLNSPMVNGSNDVLLKECLTTIQTEINTELQLSKPVKTFWFQPMQPRGCGYHPSIEDDGIMAKQLIPFIKTLL